MENDPNIKDFDENLIIRFLNGQLSIKETIQLEELIEASPENCELFRIYQKVWMGSSLASSDDRINTRQAWEKVSSEMHKPTYRQIYHSRQKIRRLYWKFTRIAAIFIAVLAMGSLLSYLMFFQHYRLTGQELSEIKVPQGSRSRIMLPDSTIVWLNAGSSLSYSSGFNRTERTVQLEGEAFFDVVTNPHKPFVVSTAHLNVKALGTQFNVKAYPEDDAVMCTLVEGKVVIEIPGAERPFQYNLEPRQNFTYRKSDMSITRDVIPEEKAEETGEPEYEAAEIIRPVTPQQKISITTNIIPELYTSWKDEIWVIEGETMADMAIMLGRRYNININIESEELKLYRFTGRIMNETLEQVLDILRMTTPLKFSVGKGTVDWDIDHDLKDKFDLILDR